MIALDFTDRLIIVKEQWKKSRNGCEHHRQNGEQQDQEYGNFCIVNAHPEEI
jgi:hypothetical protein